MTEIRMDIQIGDWPFAWQLAFRDAVKVNPQYALTEILKTISEAVDGPDDIPTGLLNIDPRWILGFVWMAERKRRPGLKFVTLLEECTEPDTYDNLVVAVEKVLVEALEKAAAEEEAAEAEKHPLGEVDESTPESKSADPTTPSSLPSTIDSQSANPSDGGFPTYLI